MTLLQQMSQERLELRESRRLAALEALKRTLNEVLSPGTQVVVFGSIRSPGRFTGQSDIDLALMDAVEPAEQTRIAVAVEEALGRPVDLVILSECRDGLRNKILREGERWTVSA